MRYVCIGVGLVAILVGVTVWRYDWALIIAGTSLLLTGIARKEMHRPNWSRRRSLTR